MLTAMVSALSRFLKNTLLILLLSAPRLALAAPQLGDPAPLFDLPLVDISKPDAPLGPQQRLTATAGKVYVIDFFATWCASCLKATESLAAVLPALGDRVQLLIVDVGEPPKRVAQHFAAHPLPQGARVVLDADGETARRFGQDRFPTTFLIDDRGVIAHINRGYGPGYPARIDRWLRQMLGLPPALPKVLPQ